MQFSVIIPLESHRGLAERCLRAWTAGQMFPREDFEVIVAAPAEFPADELADIHALLGPQDRLLTYPQQHDIALVAEGARVARGEVLVFTESHCLPEADFLARTATVRAEHPEWSGFSTRSIPLTHNLLSEIEAEMYSADIARNLETHPWLKVLDQCFVVNRAGYERCGGLEPEYGHFAEWLLAARLYRSGSKIGFDPRPAVQHYYIGDLAELKEFTEDFAAGQMLFQTRASRDPCGDLFDEVPGWSGRQAMSSDVASGFSAMLWSDFQSMLQTAWRTRNWSALRDWPWRTALSAVGNRRRPAGWHAALSRVRLAWLRAKARWRLARGQREAARQTFLRLMNACVQRGWRHTFDAWRADSTRERERRQADVSEWRAGRFEALPTIGFYGLESCNRVPFRWSGPAACIALPAVPGEWELRLEWAGCVSIDRRTQARFYHDGRRIAAEATAHFDNHSLLTIVGGDQPGCVGWVCSGGGAPLADDRTLGLPLASLAWRPARREVLPFRPADRPAAADRPVYFLHVQKAAGTTSRFVLSDGFADRDLLAPQAQFYHAREFTGERRTIPPDVAFVSGHFGWELPSAAPDRDWRVVTVVREPLDRLASLWSYVRQDRRVDRQRSFLAWLQSDLLVSETLVANFVPELLNRVEQGADAVSRVLDSHLAAAVRNLKSCVVVGRQEQMEDSLNLLCAATGCLPPLEIPHVNRTLDRTATADLEAASRRLFQRSLRSDREFYADACELFLRQRQEMHRRLSDETGRNMDATAARIELRRRYFERHSQLVSGIGDELRWSASEAFRGQNLQNREQHAGRSLRWTGPSETTRFYFPLAIGRPLEIVFRLHPATPHPHVAAARLQVNGADVPLEWEVTGEGYLLRGEFTTATPELALGRYSEILLHTPTVRGQGEFRELGVALESVEFQRAARIVSFPTIAAEQRFAA
jgi:hypothetical protein